MLTGELRQGANEGVVADAVAKASGQPIAAVRRAAMLLGDLGAARACLALTGQSLDVGLTPLTAVQPMLAGTSASVTDALAEIGLASVEWKLDGIRVQAHKRGDEVRLFSRGLNDITGGVARRRRSRSGEFRLKSVVLDGEALGIDEDGQPLIFQDTMSGLATTSAYFFDVLHVDDAVADRRSAAQPPIGAGGVAAGHVEAAVDRHRRRRRGRGVRRQRRRHGPRGCDGQGDRVARTRRVAAAPGGARSSRCTRSISSCSPPSGATAGASAGSATCTSGPAGTDGFVMVGKTFKGMTDDLLRWQTEELQRIAIATEGHTVHVRPELVVEIALDGVQRSTRYPGGVALRFARVRRYRPDKTAQEADTIERVQGMLGGVR